MAKMGRPKLFGKGVKIMKTMIYLEEGDHSQLRHISIDEHKSMSELIREAVKVFLKNYKKGARK
jgi:hypothetical protein